MTDPTTRALTLLGLLESRPVWTGADLARRFGVTTRTLRRDVDRLRGLGYTVDAGTGPGGGYALGRGQILPPLLLDEDQAVAVTLALTSVAADGAHPHAEDALRALATIDDVTPAPVRRRLAVLREAVSAAATWGTNAVAAEVLLNCAEAVRRGVRMTFDYRDRHGARSHRSAEPHHLAARGRTWHLVAYDLDRDDWRTFRLDRLADPTPGTWRFSPRAGAAAVLARLDEPPPPEAWRHEVRVHVRAPLEDVEATLPRGAGRLTALDATTTEFVTGADDPGEAAAWLARLPHDFRVLADGEVRRAVAELGRRLDEAAGRPADATGGDGR